MAMDTPAARNISTVDDDEGDENVFHGEGKLLNVPSKVGEQESNPVLQLQIAMDTIQTMKVEMMRMQENMLMQNVNVRNDSEQKLYNTAGNGNESTSGNIIYDNN